MLLESHHSFSFFPKVKAFVRQLLAFSLATNLLASVDDHQSSFLVLSCRAIEQKEKHIRRQLPTSRKVRAAVKRAISPEKRRERSIDYGVCCC